MGNNFKNMAQYEFRPIAQADSKIIQTMQGINTGRNICPERTKRFLSDLFLDKANPNIPLSTTFWGHLKNLPAFGHDVLLNSCTGAININGTTLSYMTQYKRYKNSGLVETRGLGQAKTFMVTRQLKYALYPDPAHNPYIKPKPSRKRGKIVSSVPLLAKD